MVDAPEESVGDERSRAGLAHRIRFLIEQTCTPHAIGSLAGHKGCGHLAEVGFEFHALGVILWQRLEQAGKSPDGPAHASAPIDRAIVPLQNPDTVILRQPGIVADKQVVCWV